MIAYVMLMSFSYTVLLEHCFSTGPVRVQVVGELSVHHFPINCNRSMHVIIPMEILTQLVIGQTIHGRSCMTTLTTIHGSFSTYTYVIYFPFATYGWYSMHVAYRECC